MKRKWIWFTSVAALAACNVFPAILPPDGGMIRVPGGIANTQPFFGRVEDVFHRNLGKFLLATCGCGDWRMLLQYNDGRQVQFPVEFFSEGPYVPMGPVSVYGKQLTYEGAGTVDQDSGDFSGIVEIDRVRQRALAWREDAHSLAIEACVLCHIGEDPIWPQPPNHPQYVPGVTDCFQCHTVVIN